MIDRYFDLLQEVLAKNDLVNWPFQTFNMDESGMPSLPKFVKCVGVRNPVDPSLV